MEPWTNPHLEPYKQFPCLFPVELEVVFSLTKCSVWSKKGNFGQERWQGQSALSSFHSYSWVFGPLVKLNCFYPLIPICDTRALLLYLIMAELEPCFNSLLLCKNQITPLHRIPNSAEVLHSQYFHNNHMWLVVIDSNLNLILRLLFCPNNNN